VKIDRRRFLGAGLAVASVPALGRSAAAQNFPAKPVSWIVPFAAGGNYDITSRLVGEAMGRRLGQTIVVDNRPGAGGSLGASIVADANPDGYTLLHANPGPNVNNVLMRKKPPYRFEAFAPVFFIGYVPLIIVANPKFPPNNVKELVAYAKANTAKLNPAHAGVGRRARHSDGAVDVVAEERVAGARVQRARGDVHDDLERDAGGKGLGKAALCAGLAGLEAHEVIGEELQVLRVTDCASKSANTTSCRSST